MTRSRGNDDRVLDLLLYMIPKYMNGFNNEKKNDRTKSDRVEDIEYGELYNIIKSMAFDRIKKDSMDEHKGIKIEKNDRIQPQKDDKLNLQLDKTTNVNKIEKNDRIQPQKDDKLNLQLDKASKENKMYTSQFRYNYKGINLVLEMIKNQKIGLITKTGEIENLIILSVSEEYVKFKTEKGSIIVVPINKVCAVHFYEMSSLENIKNYCSNAVKKWNNRSLSEYLYSIIGEKVFIHIETDNEFRYFYSKEIVVVGEEFIIIEGNIMIFINKIVFIEVTKD